MATSTINIAIICTALILNIAQERNPAILASANDGDDE